MQRLSATVVALVGERARPCAQALGTRANVRAVLADESAPALERASATLRAATGAKADRHAPARVVPCAGTPEAAAEAIRALRAGRWWPALDRLLAAAQEAAPDQLLSPRTAPADLHTP
ncbi:MAG TPA: hypothetical protein VG452_13170 [Egibacteraceae bacterium]|nr:hypothetical protein [Egibacteraceae bacterium]